MPAPLLILFCVFSILPFWSLSFIELPWVSWDQGDPLRAVVSGLAYFLLPLFILITMAFRSITFLPIFIIECLALTIHTVLHSPVNASEWQWIRYTMISAAACCAFFVFNRDSLYPFLSKSTRFWRKSQRISTNVKMHLVVKNQKLPVVMQDISLTGMNFFGDSTAILEALESNGDDDLCFELFLGGQIYAISGKLCWTTAHNHIRQFGLKVQDHSLMATVIGKLNLEGRYSKFSQIIVKNWAKTGFRRTVLAIWTFALGGSFGVPACGTNGGQNSYSFTTNSIADQRDPFEAQRNDNVSFAATYCNCDEPECWTKRTNEESANALSCAVSAGKALGGAPAVVAEVVNALRDIKKISSIATFGEHMARISSIFNSEIECVADIISVIKTLSAKVEGIRDITSNGIDTSNFNHLLDLIADPIVLLEKAHDIAQSCDELGDSPEIQNFLALKAKFEKLASALGRALAVIECGVKLTTSGVALGHSFVCLAIERGNLRQSYLNVQENCPGIENLHSCIQHCVNKTSSVYDLLHKSLNAPHLSEKLKDLENSCDRAVFNNAVIELENYYKAGLQSFCHRHFCIEGKREPEVTASNAVSFCASNPKASSNALFYTLQGTGMDPISYVKNLCQTSGDTLAGNEPESISDEPTSEVSGPERDSDCPLNADCECQGFKNLATCEGRTAIDDKKCYWHPKDELCRTWPVPTEAILDPNFKPMDLNAFKFEVNPANVAVGEKFELRIVADARSNLRCMVLDQDRKAVAVLYAGEHFSVVKQGANMYGFFASCKLKRGYQGYRIPGDLTEPESESQQVRVQVGDPPPRPANRCISDQGLPQINLELVGDEPIARDGSEAFKVRWGMGEIGWNDDYTHRPRRICTLTQAVFPGTCPDLIRDSQEYPYSLTEPLTVNCPDENTHVGFAIACNIDGGVARGCRWFGLDGHYEANESSITGCMDPDANNFNPDATQDDATCVYGVCPDPEAENYDATAHPDKASMDECTYRHGCMNPEADNFDPQAVRDDGTCDYHG
jgi:hypothetical protein